MLKINEKRGLGLERTVQWCVDNIDNIYETSEILSKFGIRVIDNLPNQAELLLRYPPATYTGEFGNAVLVGTATPYNYYIWTREFPDQIDPENPVNGEWLNIGQFPLPGPKGDTGLTGPTGSRGQRGSRIYTGQGLPTNSNTPADTIEGDLYINSSNGVLYQAVLYATGISWRNITSLRGPAGQAGQDGSPGPAGPVVDLVGTLATVEELPSVESALAQYGRQVAYLIGAEGSQKSVYGLIGPDDNLSWSNLGLFAAGTIVSVNGTPVESLDMANYVPKVVNTTDTYSVSAYNKNTSAYEALPISDDDVGNTIALRKIGGILEVGTPLDPRDAANKTYVDTKISEMAEQIGSGAPERYFKNIPLSYREYVEEEGDITITEYPKYIELKPGMEFDLVAAVDSQEVSYIGLYVDLLINNSSGAAFYTEYEGENDGKPEATHQGLQKYHVVVSKVPVRYPNGTWVDQLIPEITAYYRNGTTKVVFPDLLYASQNVSSYVQANLRLQMYNYPTYYNNFLYYGNTDPNVSLSEIK